MKVERRGGAADRGARAGARRAAPTACSRPCAGSASSRSTSSQPVERPQHLVLFSRLGPGYDRAELDRLLWEERALFEWDAFIYPIEDLPLVRARIRELPPLAALKERALGARVPDREPRVPPLRPARARARGPLLSRDLEDRSKGEKRDHRWWGPRMVGLMLAVAPPLRRDHRRRAPGRRAALGPHDALVARNGDRLDPRRRADPGGARSSAARASGS